jgi:hypothetical protein
MKSAAFFHLKSFLFTETHTHTHTHKIIFNSLFLPFNEKNLLWPFFPLMRAWYNKHKGIVLNSVSGLMTMMLTM